MASLFGKKGKKERKQERRKKDKGIMRAINEPFYCLSTFYIM